MTRLSTWAVSMIAGVTVTAASVTACRKDVPGPTLPVPAAPEVSPVGPKPKPLDPSNAPRRAKPKRVGHTPDDGGVSDVINLPENPDADVTVVTDAGQPLK